MLVKGGCGDIILQGGVTNGVTNVLWKHYHECSNQKGPNNLVHTSTKNYVEPINILIFFTSLGFK